jgi:hypothetical protein
MLEAAGVECPYCGERFETTADTSGGEQDYIEDCPVCCRPIEFHLETGLAGELVSLTPRRDDD